MLRIQTIRRLSQLLIVNYPRSLCLTTTINYSSFKFPLFQKQTRSTLAIVHDRQSNEDNNNNDDNQKPKHFQLRWDLITSILVLLGIEDSSSDDRPKDSPLILAIKRGILAKQRKQHHYAEMLLHTALKMAQDLSYTDAETYIFDVMADNYFEKGDYKRAIDLYLEVLTRLSKREDFTQDCEALIEISIKLSYCYGQLNQPDSAEKGFQFSIDTQLIRTDTFFDDRNGELRSIEWLNNDEQRNSLALLGMAYDYYSKHLEKLSSKLLDRALIYRTKALKISIIVNGNEHQQTLILENDIADLYARMEKFNHAKRYLRNAIDKAQEMQLIDLLPILYMNLASIYCQNNRPDLAKKYCHQTMDIVSKWPKQSSNDKFEQLLTEKERTKLMEKCELCLNGQRFY
ncbi:tetratricopeptide repeat domain 19 [Dermatophagoides pteronyssinus]|uniref:Tetratricopeptide repeat protein 19 homolog, mitochondrial-like n=1 Tax=Dermatophagoides pteronyssinus TaxID=6956 RepID=A0A6P6YJ98_DERPT|nr:tetratricopeptide repeat protein 19 homolog, mitochondrial-like [Dermatophagoides pteronyssinus]